MKKSLLALCLAACAAPPQLLPPPFGPGDPTNPRLFFPTGMAVLPDGALLVANGNFDHAFDSGTVVSIRKSYLDAFFARRFQGQKLDCDVPAAQALAQGCDDDVTLHPAEVFGGAAMIGNYAGPLALNSDATIAYTGSRDTNRLNAVSVLADRSLQCAPGAGTGQDCRQGVIDLGLSGVNGPYSIVAGDLNLPGQAAQPVLFVASLVPRVDEISSSLLLTDAPVVALDVRDPAQPPAVLFQMLASSRFVANGSAVGPMVFDAARRQLLLSGCYERFASGAAGEPGSRKCFNPGVNYLRTLKVDAQGAAQVGLFDMVGDVLSTDTTALLLGDEVGGVPTTLWATMRSPDVLVRIELPLQPSVAPRVRQIIPLPIAPAELVSIPRTGAPDLLAIIAEGLGAVVIYDTGQMQVQAQVERLGDSPFTIKLLPSSDPATAQLAVSVFGSCRIALVEVPLDKPWTAALRGRAGSCP
jgi:hypothetical protein